jgi:hypothetical protein
MRPGGWRNHMYKTKMDIMLLTNSKNGHVCKLEDGYKGMMFLDGKTYGKQLTDAFDRKVDQKRQPELEKQKGF